MIISKRYNYHDKAKSEQPIASVPHPSHTKASNTRVDS